MIGSVLPRNVTALLLLSLWLPGTWRSAEGQTPTFRTDTKLVLVRFQVVPKRGQLIRDVQMNDIAVLEDGVPQPIAVFQGGRSSPQTVPTEIHLLFDCSSSVARAWHIDPRVIDDNLLSEYPHVSLAIWGFAAHLYYILKPTRDTSRLAEAMRAPCEPDIYDQTALYNAITQVIAEVAKPSGGIIHLIVPISDGIAYLDAGTREKTVQAANNTGVAIFPVLLGRNIINSADPLDPQLFRSLGESTGGSAIDFTHGRPPNILATILSRIARDIRNDYVTGFYERSPTNDKQSHKIRIVLKNGKLGTLVGGTRSLVN